MKGLFPSDHMVLVGSVVRYDSFMSSNTSGADFVVRLKQENKTQYIRLRYAPDGFGFDAPAATPTQLLPKEMFSDGNRVWIFSVHAPRDSEEESACTSQNKSFAPAKDGSLVEIERYEPLPDSQDEEAPKPESLRCLILQSWSSDSGDIVGPCRLSVPHEVQDATFTAVYKFETKDGNPSNIKRVRNLVPNDSEFTTCISRWNFLWILGEAAAEFRYKTGEGWIRMSVSGLRRTASSPRH